MKDLHGNVVPSLLPSPSILYFEDINNQSHRVRNLVLIPECEEWTGTLVTDRKNKCIALNTEEQ